MTGEEINDWLGDDETFGREMKKGFRKLFNKRDSTALTFIAITKILVGFCLATNAEKYESTLEEMTHKNNKIGDWKVTIERTKAP